MMTVCGLEEFCRSVQHAVKGIFFGHTENLRLLVLLACSFHALSLPMAGGLELDNL